MSVRSGQIYEIHTCLVGEPITANSIVELLQLKLQHGNGGSILKMRKKIKFTLQLYVLSNFSTFAAIFFIKPKIYSYIASLCMRLKKWRSRIKNEKIKCI